MVLALKPPTQVQQHEVDSEEAHKHKSRLSSVQTSQHGETLYHDDQLGCTLLRLMSSWASAEDTTWSSVGITSAFLNADIHNEDTVSDTPPPILVKMNIVIPILFGTSRRPSMDFEKHRVFDKEKGINNFEILSSTIRTRRRTWSKATLTLACGRPTCSTASNTTF